MAVIRRRIARRAVSSHAQAGWEGSIWGIPVCYRLRLPQNYLVFFVKRLRNILSRAIRLVPRRAKGVPGPVPAVLHKAEEFRGMELVEGFFEKETGLRSRGRPSQTDLLALIGDGEGFAVLGVEGKVDEPFGPLVSEWLVDASANKRMRFFGVSVPSMTQDSHARLCAILGYENVPRIGCGRGSCFCRRRDAAPWRSRGALPGRWPVARQEPAAGDAAAERRHQDAGADQDDARDAGLQRSGARTASSRIWWTASRSPTTRRSRRKSRTWSASTSIRRTIDEKSQISTAANRACP